MMLVIGEARRLLACAPLSFPSGSSPILLGIRSFVYKVGADVRRSLFLLSYIFMP